MTGGGLIRSLGGWTEVKRESLKGRDHVMSDERILGDSDFVDSIISQSEEQYELCFWAARELGMSLTALAKILEMSIAGVGFAVERGELIAKKDNFNLTN